MDDADADDSEIEAMREMGLRQARRVADAPPERRCPFCQQGMTGKVLVYDPRCRHDFAAEERLR